MSANVLLLTTERAAGNEPLAGSHFVWAHPPPASWQPAQARALEQALEQPAPPAPPGLYSLFGGGTPSTLTTSQVRSLGIGLRSALAWDIVDEVTFECAPRSVRRELLEILHDLGVNRLSLGVQSFNHPLPALNGRIDPAGDTLIRRPGVDRLLPRFYDPQHRDGRSAWN